MKVTRLTMQNAAPETGLLLTTEALVTEKSEEKKAPKIPSGPGGMGDMDY